MLKPLSLNFGIFLALYKIESGGSGAKTLTQSR
jgi:hypothetical protein